MNLFIALRRCFRASCLIWCVDSHIASVYFINFSLNISFLDCEHKIRRGIEEFMFHFAICQKYAMIFKQLVYSFFLNGFLFFENLVEHTKKNMNEAKKRSSEVMLLEARELGVNNSGCLSGVFFGIGHIPRARDKMRWCVYV